MQLLTGSSCTCIMQRMHFPFLWRVRVMWSLQIYWIYLLYFLGLLERCWKPPAGRAVFNVPLFTGWCAASVVRAQLRIWAHAMSHTYPVMINCFSLEKSQK